MKQVCSNVSITPAMDRFIAAPGRDRNTGDAVRAAPRALKREEAVERERRLRLAAGVER